MSVCLSVYMSVCLHVCLSVCLHVCLSVCLSTCLSVCLSTCLSVCLSTCLSVCLSTCLSVCPFSEHVNTSLCNLTGVVMADLQQQACCVSLCTLSGRATVDQDDILVDHRITGDVACCQDCHSEMFSLGWNVASAATDPWATFWL